MQETVDDGRKQIVTDPLIKAKKVHWGKNPLKVHMTAQKRSIITSHVTKKIDHLTKS